MASNRKTIAAAITAVFSAALLAAAVTPASAGQDPGATGNHAMGSTIRAHEGAMTGLGAPASAAASVQGIDVASYQGNVDWAAQYKAGKRFVWVKATEGTGYINPYFDQQYTGSYQHGLIHGAYHFARPGESSGAAQASYFVAHGGGWSADAKTLPGTLDLEYGPNGNTCWGLSKSAMTAWIKDFSDTYKAKAKRYPAFYTSTNWWSQCVSGTFSTTNPLWVARYASSVGTLPNNWTHYTVWQYSSSNNLDKDQFNGTSAQLTAFAKNG